MSGYYAIQHSGVTKEGRESGVLGVERRQSATLSMLPFFFLALAILFCF